ncbi:MAG: hypothetical protein KKB22_07085 [Candidatus Omnitrophica bacterium]|nr:hypothetical protein [Candidatus Omnitrophota bacterium]
MNDPDPGVSGFVWQPLAKHNIKWTPTGSFTTVKVEYSTNAFINEGETKFINLVTNSAHNVQKVWELSVPNDIDSTVALRISNNADPDTKAVSGEFKIANIQVTYPVQSQEFICETAEHIDFTVSGDIAAVDIRYSIGAGWNDIELNYSVNPGTNSYPWTVLTSTGTNTVVKVSHASALSTVYDDSDAFIIRGGFTFDEPDPGDGWLATSSKLIEWTTLGIINNVYLQYRYKYLGTQNWSDWEFVNGNSNPVSNASNNATWTPLPDIIADEVELKITDANDSAATKTSGVFKIYGQLTLTQPNGQDKLKAGKTGPETVIKWTRIGPIPGVDLAYSTTGVDGNYTTFATNQPAGQDYTTWSPPVLLSDICYMRIRDTHDSAVEDKSNAAFFIKENFTVTRPNGAEPFVVSIAGDQSTYEEITWTSANLATNVILKYSMDYSLDPQNASWSPISTEPNAASGTYDWEIPSALSETCRVRVSDATDDAESSDISDNDFYIRGKITVLEPNGGEKWKCTEQEWIRWSWRGNITRVDIEYWNGTAWIDIDDAQNYLNDTGEYHWTIPSVASIAPIYKIKVSDHSKPTVVFDESDTVFKIMGRLSLTSPDGSEDWMAGSGHPVTWNRYGPSSFYDTKKIKIEYSVDDPDFTNPGLIVASTDNDGTHPWTVTPAAVSNKVRVRISQTDDPDVYDISEGIFIVRASFELVTPNGGQMLVVGDHYDISWTQVGITKYNNGTPLDPSDDYDAAKLWCYKSGQSSTFFVIDEDAPLNAQGNGGTYDWTIPNQIREDWVLRVEDPNDPTAFDDSGDYPTVTTFKIKPGFTVTLPISTSIWYIGESATINWDYTGTVTTVGVWYSTGGMAGPWRLLYSPPASAKEYIWTNVTHATENIITDQLKVKVGHPTDTEAFAIGPYTVDEYDQRVYDGPPYAKISSRFTIDPAITNQQLVVGDTFAVTWNNTGTVDFVDITYSTDDFATESPLLNASSQPATNIANSPKSFSWKVPDIFAEISDIAKASTVKIRVRSHSDADGASKTGNFRIKGNVWVITPLLDENLEIGKSAYPPPDNTPFIKWGWVGTMPNVKITYSLDGAAFNPIDENNNGLPDDDGIVPNGAGAGGPASEHTFTWTIPDEANGNVILRIADARPTEVDTVKADSDSFNIIGYVQILPITTMADVPVTKLTVASLYKVNWEWGGTMATVKLTYSTNGDVGPFNVITGTTGIVPNGSGGGGAGSKYSYTWTAPNAISTNCKVRIASSDPLLEDIVKSTSGVFKIQGAFSLVTPALEINDNNTPANPADDFYECRWVTNEVREVKWDTYGTINKVDLIWAKDFDSDGDVDDADFNSRVYYAGRVDLTQGSSTVNANIQYQPQWTSQIQSGDEIGFGSTNYQDITKWYTILSVNTNNPQSILLTSNYQESSDTAVSYCIRMWNSISMTGGINLDNIGKFNWTIPDERLPDLPYYVPVKVRVYDHSDHEVFVEGPTPVGAVNNMKIDYYAITWDIRDLVTNQPVSGLKAIESGAEGVTWSAQGLSSPVKHWVRAGDWTTEWTHSAYGTISESYLAGWDTEKNIWRKDRTIFRTMETVVVHIWRAYSEFSYNVGQDNLDITTWLERDGALVTGALILDVKIYDGIYQIKRKTTLVDEANNKHLYYTDVPNDKKLWIGTRYNNNNTPDDPTDDFEESRTMADVIADCAQSKTGEAVIPANFSGFFQQAWLDTAYTSDIARDKLEAGKVYTVASYIGIATGATFTTPVSFTVTIPQTMADVKAATESMEATVNSVLDKPISEVSSELQGAMVSQTLMISNKLDAQTTLIDNATKDMKATIDTAISDFTTSVQESIVALEAGVEQATTAGEELEATAKKYSWDATVTPNPALIGDDITLKCQGPEDLYPMLNIYRWDDKAIIEGVILTADASGTYTYEFKADSRFPAGKSYTYIISEQTTGGLVAGSGSVESMSLTTIAGLAASAPGAERIAKKALDAIKAVESVVISKDNINIALTLQNLKQSVDLIPSAFAKDGPSSQLNQAVADIANRLKSLAGDQGYDIGKLFESALSDSPTIKDMRKSTDEIQGASDVMIQLFEKKLGGMEDAFVSTSLEPGSVKFKVVAANPSRIKPQSIEIKYYLPEEVKPKDVMELSGLALEFDAEKSIYYLYKQNLELAPGEVRSFNVEVEDIWIISDNKLAELNNRTDAVMAKIEKTEYYASARPIADSIYARLQEIRATQVDDTISRSQHIGIYRQNVIVTNEIKEDIDKLEKTLATAGGPLAPDMLAKTKIKAEEPTKSMTWIVIFVIIIFTGLLTAALFFTWLRQGKGTKEALLEAKKAAFPESEEGQGPKEENFEKPGPPKEGT